MPVGVLAAPAPGPLPLPLSGVGAEAAFWDGRAETADAADVVVADAPGDDGPAGTDDSRCPGGSGTPSGVGGIGGPVAAPGTGAAPNPASAPGSGADISGISAGGGGGGGMSHGSDGSGGAGVPSENRGAFCCSARSLFPRRARSRHVEVVGFADG